MTEIGAERGVEVAVLEAIQDRVLWLATSIVAAANRRPNRSGIKVGGHQASSASMVSIMVALYFAHLRAQDRVSVKPHAAPVLHAIEYLLGRLDPSYLTRLRAYRGLQSYPSRLKDPVPVDFSTGSVGIGATAPIWSAVAHRYVARHFDVPAAGRHISLVGDAELDEGACWEAVLDPIVRQLGDVLWIVDMNRQSLDRVVPNIAADRLLGMFEAAGWHTVTLKYGRRLQQLFDRDEAGVLRRRIDEMPNEEYQHLLRTPASESRAAFVGDGADRRALDRALSDVEDAELAELVRDLGGHDLEGLLAAFRQADAVTDRPTVVFAYTLKGWRLPMEGHPYNHSALVTSEQWEELAARLGADAADEWAVFPPDSAEAAACREAGRRLERAQARTDAPRCAIPAELGGSHRAVTSTQETFGRLLATLASRVPEVAERIVTVSPDVAASTNLGSWINKVGVFHVDDRPDWFADDRDMLVRWRESGGGQHIELGIAETNLVSLLSELGTTWSRDGEPLFPIGTLYDPFVNRALEPWSFGIYAGGQSILVGTPSGVTLAPEGGAHQSIVTPSVGLEQPGCIAWEPAFAQDLEWTLLHALGLLGRAGGSSSYFRLSTRPLDQSLAELPSDPLERARRRDLALRGGYPVRLAPGVPAVTLVGVGAVLPEVVAAADALAAGGFGADVVCLTSADLIFRAFRARGGLAAGPYSILDDLFPPERAAPIVTVLDGHPHTLSFLGAIRTQPLSCLGVDDFGESGEIDELYERFGIDADTIVGAALDLVE